MCLLAILWNVAEDSPLIVAANREEAYARVGTPPQVVGDPVRFVAGLDPVAGGTWLGLTAKGLLAAVTNRAKTTPVASASGSESVADASGSVLVRSRGLLLRDLLQCGDAGVARDAALEALSAQPYAGCNLLLADRANAYVIHAGDWLRVVPLAAGSHVLTRNNLNDDFDPRNRFARAWLAEQTARTASDWIEKLKQLCGLHADADNPAICLHGAKGGTVSSSIIALRQPIAASNYWHAQGPPDNTAYDDCSALLAACLAQCP